MHYSKYKNDWLRNSMGLASAQQSYIHQFGLANVPPLPAGWKEGKDEVTGLMYYTEITTKKRTWVRPGFIPPPPGQRPPKFVAPPPAPSLPPPPPRQNYYGGAQT